MGTRDLIRLAECDGWSVTRTGGDHRRLTHLEATTVVLAGSTPSDSRATRTRSR